MTGNYEAGFKRALFCAVEFTIYRYLMSCADGRKDGIEKADCHRQLCEVFGKAFGATNKFDRLHKETQKLTGYMDKVIGFPLKGRPDYEKLAPKFFRKFYEHAIWVLGVPKQ